MNGRSYIKWICAVLMFCIALSACASVETQPTEETKGIETQSTEETLPTEETQNGALVRDCSFTLTPEQTKNYKSAVSYLVKREGETLYRIQYSNCGVTYTDGTLNTNYDGMAVELSKNGEEWIYPVLDLREVQDTQCGFGSVLLYDAQAESTVWRYMVQTDKSNNQAVLAAMKQRDGNDDAQLLSGAYDTLPDFSQYRQMKLSAGYIYQIPLDDDNKPLPVSQWEKTDWATLYDYSLSDNLRLNYVPLVGGEYYMLYEITDVNGNVYCSELIPYPTEPAPPAPEKEPDIRVKWEKGVREQLLLEQDGIAVYVSVEKDIDGESYYALKVRNNRDRKIYAVASNVVINGMLDCGAGSSVRVDPGKFVADSLMGFSFGIVECAPEMETLSTMQMIISVVDSDTWEPLMEEQTVLIDMTESWPVEKTYADYGKFEGPAMGAFAQEQVILDDGEVRVVLIGAGTTAAERNGKLTLVFRVENLSKQTQSVNLAGLAINNVFVVERDNTTVAAGHVAYMYALVYDFSLEKLTNTSIETIDVLLQISGRQPWIFPVAQQRWVPVVLSQAGKAVPFNKGTPLWESGGIQIGSRGFDEIAQQWTLTVTNNTEETICLEITDADTGEKLGVFIYAGPGQHNCFQVEAAQIQGTGGAGPRRIQIKVYDYSKQKVLLETTEAVLLEMT